MATPDHHLPPGTLVDRYAIEKAIGGGGFSVVYRAEDTRTGEKVVIKEYMPAKLATRSRNHFVAADSESDVERFAQGKRLFFQEASTLATLKHPNIVDVINFFRANGTVYMVMRYEEGVNLHAYIKKHRKHLSENFIRTVFVPLLEGLQVIHSQGLLHLDIKPGNIHLCNGGRPLLLDFGAVHEMMATRQFQTSQVVTPGYSPIEQLDPGGYVGPWTDIYAVGATMRTCLDGKTPPSAIDRREKEVMRPATSAFRKRYSQELLQAIDRAMEVDPMLRPQRVEVLLEDLNKEPAAEPEARTGSWFGRFQG